MQMIVEVVSRQCQKKKVKKYLKSAQMNNVICVTRFSNETFREYRNYMDHEFCSKLTNNPQMFPKCIIHL